MHVSMHTCPVACRQTIVTPSAYSKHLSVTSQRNLLQGRYRSRASVSRLQVARQPHKRAASIEASSGNGAQLVPAKRAVVSEKEGPSTDFKVIWSRLWKVDNRLLTFHAATSDFLTALLTSFLVYS